MSEIPYSYPWDTAASAVAERWSSLEPGEESGAIVAVAGRIMLSRPQGKLAFAELRDSSGSVQLFCLAKVTEDFEAFTHLSLGDWIGATGEVVRTKRGELSVKVTSWQLLAEARRSFGDKWHGVSDVETRYRQREVDLWANEDSRGRLLARSALIRNLRERLWGQGFVEVETPILNPIAGGAAARPFTTHHNALDATFYLRIAPELYLKRLVVGGFERVFEIGRLFRNEGISTRHNPEFTTVEAYIAYMDYLGLMELVEELVAGIVMDVCGTTTLSYQGQTIEMGAPWRRATMAELTSEAVGRPVDVTERRSHRGGDAVALRHEEACRLALVIIEGCPEDLAQPRPDGRVGQRHEHRVGVDALSEVLARRLAQLAVDGGDVEDVVSELEDEADRLAVGVEGLGPLVRGT